MTANTVLLLFILFLTSKLVLSIYLKMNCFFSSSLYCFVHLWPFLKGNDYRCIYLPLFLKMNRSGKIPTSLHQPGVLNEFTVVLMYFHTHRFTARHLWEIPCVNVVGVMKRVENTLYTTHLCTLGHLIDSLSWVIFSVAFQYSFKCFNAL